MKLRKFLSVLLLAAGVVFTAGRQEAEGADTPSEVLLKIHRAIKNLDFDTCAKLTYGQANVDVRKMEKFVAGIIEAARSGDENAERRLNELKTSLRKWRIEIKDEKIDGDLAVVEVVDVNALSGKDGSSTQEFKKVDGEWKLIDSGDYRKALASRKRKAKAAKPADSPSEVMRKCVAAIKALDYVALAELCHGKQKAEFRKIADGVVSVRTAARNGDERAKKILDEAQAKVAKWTVKIKGETIDGDLAVVTVECSGNPAGPGSDVTGSEFFRKVDGQWKWINTEDHRELLAARKAKAAKPADTPSAVVGKYVEAMRNNDFATVASLCHGELKTVFQKFADDLERREQAARSGDAAARKQLDDELRAAQRIRVEINREKIDGDLAEVDIVISGADDGGNGPTTACLKRVAGEWKMISNEDFAREKAAR